MSEKTYLKTNWPPFAAIAVAAAAALTQVARPTPPVAAAPAPPPQPAEESTATDDPMLSDDLDPLGAPATEDDDDEGAATTTVSGEVLEQIDVGKYSYLRVGARGTPGIWAAVAKTAKRVGEPVVVKNAELMTSFVSATLNRTFDQIYFGFLDTGTNPPVAGAGPHAAGTDPHAGLGAADPVGPHPGPGAGADAVPVGRVARAQGPFGRTVAELSRGGAEISGQKARVRGIVVKSTRGVLGRTFLHLRDGSGSATDSTNDLTVTTRAEPAVGTEILVEGIFQTDQDFGSGYRYKALLADATLVTNP